MTSYERACRILPIGLLVGTAVACAVPPPAAVPPEQGRPAAIAVEPAPSARDAPVIDPSTLGTGGSFSCVLEAGAVRCWGSNDDGQLGHGSGRGPTVQGLEQAVSLSVGEFHACALTANRSVYCWGRNREGQVSRTLDAKIASRAVKVAGLDGLRVAEVSAGSYHTCVRTEAGSVVCWGDNDWWQLGHEGKAKASQLPIEGVCAARQLAPGARSHCALCTGGNVECWGDVSEGQLGDGTRVKGVPGQHLRALPGRVVGLSNVERIARTNFSGCALTERGQVWCWGWNLRGTVGDGTVKPRSKPVRVLGLDDAEHLWSRGDGYCVRRRSKEVWCWGGNLYGDLGDGTRRPRLHMVRAPSWELGEPATGSNGYHSCVHKAPRQILCWGRNHEGQLGNGNKQDSRSPQVVSVFGDAVPVPKRQLDGAIRVSVEQGGRALDPVSGAVVVDRSPFTLVLRFHRDDSLFVKVSATAIGAWTPAEGGSFAESPRNRDRDVFLIPGGQHYWFFDSREDHRFDGPCVETGEWRSCRRTVAGVMLADKSTRSLAAYPGDGLHFGFASQQRNGPPLALQIRLRATGR